MCGSADKSLIDFFATSYASVDRAPNVDGGGVYHLWWATKVIIIVMNINQFLCTFFIEVFQLSSCRFYLQLMDQIALKKIIYENSLLLSLSFYLRYF